MTSVVSAFPWKNCLLNWSAATGWWRLLKMRLFVVAALTLSSLCAQQYPDGATLTKQAEAAVKKVHSLQFKDEMTMETAFGGQNVKMTTEASRAVLNPGKM